MIEVVGVRVETELEGVWERKWVEAAVEIKALGEVAVQHSLVGEEECSEEAEQEHIWEEELHDAVEEEVRMVGRR